MPRPQTFQLQKAEYQTFLLRYCLFLYQQWFFQNIEKDLRIIFDIILFSQFPQNDIIKKYISFSFFLYLTEPLLVQKQTIPQQKGLILSSLELGKFEVVALSRVLHAHLPPKDIEKKVNLTEQSQDSKKIIFDCANFILIS